MANAIPHSHKAELSLVAGQPQHVRDRVLRLKGVIDRVGLAKSTIYGLMNAGKFPSSMRLSTRAIGWRESDINQWINDRLKGTLAQ